MTSPRKFSPGDDEAIEAMAAAWLAQKDDGFTPADEKAFEQWRGSDARYEAAVAHLEATWNTLVQLRNFRPDARRHPDCDLLVARRPRPNRLVPLVALAMAAAVVFGFMWRRSAKPALTAALQTAPNQVYATSAGGFQRVVLEDGSTVELLRLT